MLIEEMLEKTENNKENKNRPASSHRDNNYSHFGPRDS
jgi:hypothetical protein